VRVGASSGVGDASAAAPGGMCWCERRHLQGGSLETFAGLCGDLSPPQTRATAPPLAQGGAPGGRRPHLPPHIPAPGSHVRKHTNLLGVTTPEAPGSCLLLSVSSRERWRLFTHAPSVPAADGVAAGATSRARATAPARAPSCWLDSSSAATTARWDVAPGHGAGCAPAGAN
jgi:hypothetical protein